MRKINSIKRKGISLLMAVMAMTPSVIYGADPITQKLNTWIGWASGTLGPTLIALGFIFTGVKAMGREEGEPLSRAGKNTMIGGIFITFAGGIYKFFF
jgi:hypothetical protein